MGFIVSITDFPWFSLLPMIPSLVDTFMKISSASTSYSCHSPPPNEEVFVFKRDLELV